MSKMYSWVVNVLKFNRAVALSTSKTEEDVMRLYVEMGGLVKPGYVAKKGNLEANIEKATVKEVEHETPVETANEVPAELEKVTEEVATLETPVVIKRRGRPAKNA